MTSNVGTIDRVIRALAGIALVAAAFLSGLPIFDGALLKYGSGIVGLVLIVTAAARFCPLYRILGVGTCRL